MNSKARSVPRSPSAWLGSGVRTKGEDKRPKANKVRAPRGEGSLPDPPPLLIRRGGSPPPLSSLSYRSLLPPPRHLAQSLYNGERYYLQIDAHMRLTRCFFPRPNALDKQVNALLNG